MTQTTARYENDPQGDICAAEWEAYYRRGQYINRFASSNLVRLLYRLQKGLGGFDKRRLVDVGCGGGRHLIMAREMGFGEATGLEIAPASLAVCREALARRGLEADLRLFDGIEIDPDLRGGVFVCWNLFDHMFPHTASLLLGNIAPAAAGGAVVCAVHGASFADQARGPSGDRFYIAGPEHQEAGVPQRFFSPEDIRTLIGEAGLPLDDLHVFDQRSLFQDQQYETLVSVSLPSKG